MLKKTVPLFLFFLVLFAVACTGVPASYTRTAAPIETTGSFFNSIPAGNELTFIGVAGRRSDPKETLQLALEDAARQVAVFFNVYGEYAVQNNIGSGLLDYAHDTQTSLSHDDGKQYVDALQFNADTDTLEMENILVVRTVYPAALPVPVRYRPVYSGADQKPDWVNDPPFEIAGYEVGIGYSSRRSSLADACTNSFHNAIFAIIRNRNTVIQSSNVQYRNTGSLFGYKTSSDNVIFSYGTLTGFYVLDTWIDPKAKTVWTLAIANKSE